MCQLLMFNVIKISDCVKSKGIIVVSSGQPSQTKVSNNSLHELIELSIHSWITEAPL